MFLRHKDSLLTYIYHLIGKLGSMQVSDTCISPLPMQPREHWRPSRGSTLTDIRSISNSVTTPPSQMYRLHVITNSLLLGLIRIIPMWAPLLTLRSYQELDNLLMTLGGQIRPQKSKLQRSRTPKFQGLATLALKAQRCLTGIMWIRTFLCGILLLSQKLTDGHLALIWQHLGISHA